MKVQKYLLLVIAVALLTAFAGCLNVVVDEEQKIEVQQRVGDESVYEDFNEITNNDQVKKVKKILSDIEWKDAKVQMAHPPDYRFMFQFINPDLQAKAVSYNLWISPNGDLVEIVKEDNAYTKLNMEDSSILFEILTGENLPY